MRECLQDWPLYGEDDHVQVRDFDREGKGLWIGYCGKCALKPFTASTHVAVNPPHMFDLNIVGDTAYLLFIQVAYAFRGQGHGEQLYEIVTEICRRLDAKQLRQTPSGGYDDQCRKDYLLKRGWLDDGGEVYRDLQTEVCHEPT